MKRNFLWWLIPIAIVLAILAALLIFGSESVSPFLYTIF